MTREQAKQNLISIGISEPTDEQVSNYLNQLNGETKKEKDKAAEYKAKADKADVNQKLMKQKPETLRSLKKPTKHWKRQTIRLRSYKKTMQLEICVKKP